MRVVATAGHVDHGKSSLVLALTGTDPDRFPEEKARGLTIDLGFAFTSLPTGEVVGFVDVPGHVKFVKNMLAGVGAIDVALLVVAANEGWMPQTEEHVRILELLDVQHGAIALTKAGLVDDDGLELARLDLDDHTAGTALEQWPVVVVDSVSGIGVDAVRSALDAVLGAAPPPRDRGRPRLWVDRVFSPRGAGTVVTGTLVGGAFAIDDDVVVEPGSHRARIRGIESHHDRLTTAAPGSRVALNLAGVDHHSIARGHAVVGAGAWTAVDVVDVALRIIPGEKIARRSILDVHVGSGQHRAIVRALDTDARFARVRFGVSLPLAVGDRFVLRSSARQTTIGGAEVLDLAPARRIADAVARLGLPLGSRLLAARSWLRVADIEARAGIAAEEADALVVAMLERGDAVRAGDWIVTHTELERVVAGAAELVTEHHRDHPAEAGMDVVELARTLRVDRGQLRAALTEQEQLVVARDVVAMSGHRGAAHQEDGRRLLDALAASPFAPPAPADVDVDQAVAKALVRDGAAVELDGVLFASSALDAARETVAAAVRDRGTLTIAEIRDLLGSTRKYVMPLVNRLDAEGVTRRRGDLRIPGPRA